MLLGRLVLVSVLIGNICYADPSPSPSPADSESSIYLNKGDKSPYNGYLLPQSEVIQLRNNTIERDGLKTINSSLTQQLSLEQQDNKLQTDKINLLLDQNDKLDKAAYQERELNTWEKVAWFVGGVLATGLAVYGVHQIYGSH